MLTWLEAHWPSELNVASLCWRLKVLQVLILNVIIGLSQLMAGHLKPFCEKYTVVHKVSSLMIKSNKNVMLSSFSLMDDNHQIKDGEILGERGSLKRFGKKYSYGVVEDRATTVGRHFSRKNAMSWAASLLADLSKRGGVAIESNSPD